MIQKILNVEELNYSSNLNEEGLKQKIEELFEEKSLRVAGKITSENRFTVYDKWIVVGWDMPNLKRKAAYLYGKIIKGEKGTLVKLKVKPNSILPIFAIGFVLIGLVFTFRALSSIEGDPIYLMIGLVFMALGIIYYPMSILLKNRLRNKIVDYLDLSKV